MSILANGNKLKLVESPKTVPCRANAAFWEVGVGGAPSGQVVPSSAICDGICDEMKDAVSQFNAPVKLRTGCMYQTTANSIHIFDIRSCFHKVWIHRELRMLS